MTVKCFSNEYLYIIAHYREKKKETEDVPSSSKNSCQKLW